jgi:uncharacterized protein YecE (DUF72 family)
MPNTTGRIRIGCSGWQYKHWRGDFYPADLPQSRWFERYAAAFDTVEINNSFYRLPETATFHSWGVRAPLRFLFAVKASRFLTHMKKLKDPEQPLDLFFSRALALGRKLGPVLYQLPPGFKHNQARLEAFLAALPQDVRHTVEFRDPSWYVPQVWAALARHNVALCLHDMPGSQTGRNAVGPFVYVRFHGSTARYQGGYSDEQLARWAEWIAEQLGRGTDVYAYFNNDMGGHAPRDAMTLRRQVADLLGNETPVTAPQRRFAGRHEPRSEAASRL